MTDRPIDDDRSLIDVKRHGLPIVDPAELGPSEREVTVVGLVLAAGTSSRFGKENKLLAELERRPIVEHSVQSLAESNVSQIYTVISGEDDRVRQAVAPNSRIVVNDAYRQGQATSIRAGIEAIRRRTVFDAVVITLGDMPFVEPATVDSLIDVYRLGIADVAVAGYRKRRGNPVLFDASYLDSLAAVSGDTGARHLITEDDAVLVETGDPGVVQDIDTPTDLDRFEEEGI